METKMWIEGNPAQNPKDTSRINRNVIVRRGSGDIIPERGFQRHDDKIGIGKKPIGEIPLFDEDFLVFSTTPQSSSEIGIVDRNGLYKTVFNDVALKFDIHHPVVGRCYKNYKGERIVTFTDFYNVPRIVNIDRIQDYNTIDKMEMFLNAVRPDMTVDVVETIGGGVETGAYFLILQYETRDYATTDWFLGYNPAFVINDRHEQRFDTFDGNPSGRNSNKGFKLNIRNVDIDYETINIGYVQVKNGEYFAYKVNSLKIAEIAINYNEINTVVSNTKGKETLTLTEIQKIRAKYRRAKAVEQLEDQLYLGNMVAYKEPNQQKLVNELTARWHSELVQVINNDGLVPNNGQNKETGYRTNDYNNKKRGFAHGEIYCFYVRLEYNHGFGDWWLMIGREATTDELLPAAGFDGEFKKYQIQDTAFADSFGTPRGTFGCWINENEQYPKNGTYPTGNVRHFKFPTKNYMKKFVYTGSNYGTTHSSILGFKIGNMDLSKFKDMEGNPAINFQVGYAQRDNANSSTVGQSIVVVNQTYTKENDDDFPQTKFVSSGGNWQPLVKYTSNVLWDASDFNGIDNTHIRTYPPELLVTKNNPDINFIRKEYVIRAFQHSKFLHKKKNKRYTVKDYSRGTSQSTMSDPFLFRIRDSKYIPANVLLEKYDNLLQEEYLMLDVENGANLLTFQKNGEAINATFWDNNDEWNCIVTLLSIKKNYYNNFYNQQVVNTGVYGNTLGANGIIWGGDVYQCDMGMNSYGRFTMDTTGDVEEEEIDHKENGLRVGRKYIQESQFNMGFKFILDDKSKGYTDYFYWSNYQYLWNMLRDLNANDWVNGYNRDYNVLNNVEFGKIHNYLFDTNYIFPYRVVRSLKQNRESMINSWRMVMDEDKYDMPKDMGAIMNLQAIRDAMFIHMEKSLFKTRSRQKLENTEGEEVNVGFGDLFANEPVPVQDAEFGFLGTQHMFSCMLTPYGYLFADAEKKKWFIVGENSKDITALASGVESFFNEHGEIYGDNPYNGNGLTVGYDELYKRLLVTRKYRQLKPEYRSRFKGMYVDNKFFIETLKVGDIVFKDDKFQIIQ